MSSTLLRRPGLLAAVLSGGSQLVGLAQIVLLLRGTGGTAATDAYFFLFSVSLLPSQILVEGVAYPVLLNTGGSNISTVRRLRFVASGCCAAFLGVGAAILLQREANFDPQRLLALLMLNGVVVAVLWSDCVLLAANGIPTWLAGKFLPANCVACVALLAPVDSHQRVEIMVLGLLVGNCGFLAFIRRSAQSPSTQYLLSPQSVAWSSCCWFCLKAVAGYGAGTVLQGFALALPVSSVTKVSVISKVVGSAIVTTVNPILPRLIHSHSKSDARADRFARRLIIPLTMVLGLTFVGSVVTKSTIGYAVSLGLGWVISGIANAVIQRVAYRFLKPSAASYPIVALLVIAASLTALVGTGHLTLGLLLYGLISVDGLSGLLTGRAIGWRWSTHILIAVLTISAGGAVGVS